jgi:broad specificity phosphatase PhoE
MTELLLVRHGETDWNRDLRFQGHADRRLNETGREQARTIAEELAREKIDAIYTSDLARARETAELIAERAGVPFILEPQLREIDVGEWQGLTRLEIEERFPDGMRNWHERGHGWENGETYDELTERVLEAVDRIVRLHPDGRVVLVGHGGTIRAIRAHVDESTVAEHRRVLPPASNCEVFRIGAENGTLRRLD